MSILGAMYTAVSGLNAQSQALGNISDNIANSQTTGYKEVNTNFQDLITISNQNLNLPGGVTASPYYANGVQGSITQTQSATNLAVSGNGFFVVSAPTDQTGTSTTFSALPYYTRAGDFEVNRDGYVVNSEGYYLNGWSVDPTTGVPDTASLAPVQVTQLTTPPTATSQIQVVGNLPATSVVNPTPPLAPTNVKIYDSLGNPHTVTLNWTKRADNTWDLGIVAADSSISPTAGTVSGTNDQTLTDATTTANVAGVAQQDTVTVPSNGIPPGRTITYTIGANTVSVTAPVSGYTGSEAATALAAAINGNAGLAAVVNASGVSGDTFKVTADTPGTPFTGTIGGNGSGEVNSVTVNATLPTNADSLDLMINGNPVSITGPSTPISQTRTDLVNAINAAAIGVTAIADPNSSTGVLIQSDTPLATLTTADNGSTVAPTIAAGGTSSDTTTTANVTPVAQQDTLTLAGTVGPDEIGDTWKVTVGTTTVSYVNDGSETTLTEIANGLAAKINGTAGIGVTASVAGNQVILTAATPGTPFTAATAATNGSVPGFIDLRFGTTTATAGEIMSIGGQYNPSGDATIPTSQNAGDPAQIAFTVNYGTGAQKVTLDLGAFQTTDGLTQFSGTTVDIQRLSQDGLPQGLFNGININSNGDVELNYDNGKSQVVDRVPLAQFYDPTALQRQDGQAFTETFESGTARITNAGSSGAGTIKGSSLEGSNVDIAAEFAKMIVTQRAYTANTKVITTADQMLQDVLNIRQ